MTTDTETSFVPENHRNAAPLSLPGGPCGALLIHGFGGTPGELYGLAQHLAGLGYSVEVPRLAGHGGSQMTLASTTWRDWVASASTAHQALRGRCRHVVVVGFSMGGLVAIHLAAHHQFEGIVLMSTPTHTGTPLSALLPVGRFVLPYLYPLRAVNLANPAVLERVRTYLPELALDAHDHATLQRVRREFKVSLQALYQVTRLIRVARALAPRVTAPALLLQARVDEQIPTSSLDILCRELGSREKEAVRFERSGHMLPVGPERHEVYRRIADFVVRHAPITVG